MKFFIPDVESPELAEELLKSIKTLAKNTLGWETTDRRIFRVDYYHKGIYHVAEVGKVTDANNEPVIAILESHAYLVCTPTRGVLMDMPMLVGTDAVSSIEDFED